MNINVYSPNFTGTYIKSVQVLKDNKPVNVSLIELTHKDINCIDDIAELWNTDIIQKLANSMYLPLSGTKNPKVYAISTQDKNFDKVSPQKVLSMFEVTERDNSYALEYLEVKPTQKYENKKRRFSNIGKACIDYIKSRFKRRDVEIYALESAAPFYAKMGCVEAPKDGSDYRFIIPKHE